MCKILLVGSITVILASLTDSPVTDSLTICLCREGAVIFHVSGPQRLIVATDRNRLRFPGVEGSDDGVIGGHILGYFPDSAQAPGPADNCKIRQPSTSPNRWWGTRENFHEGSAVWRQQRCSQLNRIGPGEVFIETTPGPKHGRYLARLNDRTTSKNLHWCYLFFPQNSQTLIFEVDKRFHLITHLLQRKESVYSSSIISSFETASE